jgi:hypothetical protein
MAELGTQALTMEDFILTMNIVLIEVFALFEIDKAGDKLIDLAPKLNEVALKTTHPTCGH